MALGTRWLLRQRYRDFWAAFRDEYAASFRAEIDRIVAEVGS